MPPAVIVMGRPTVLTEQFVEDFIAARTQGGNDTDCALVAGIAPGTYWNWRTRYQAEMLKPVKERDTTSRPTLDELTAFYEADQRALADGRLLHLERINEAGQGGRLLERRVETRKDGSEVVTERYARGQWQADAWWLERKFPQEYGLRRYTEVLTKDRIDEEIDKLNTELARRAAAGDTEAAEILAAQGESE